MVCTALAALQVHTAAVGAVRTALVVAMVAHAARVLLELQAAVQTKVVVAHLTERVVSQGYQGQGAVGTRAAAASVVAYSQEVGLQGQRQRSEPAHVQLQQVRLLHRQQNMQQQQQHIHQQQHIQQLHEQQQCHRQI